MALQSHIVPVTRLISVSIKILKVLRPITHLIVSYADRNENHLGVIYQAGNWIYEGVIGINRKFFIMPDGEFVHTRTLHHRHGTANIVHRMFPKGKIYVSDGRHKYHAA